MVMPSMNFQQFVLHNPFNIRIHKKTFINYLEVVILEDGTIEYAIPSHQEKLIAIIMKKYNMTKEEIINDPESYCEYMEYLHKKSGAISVWNDFYLGNANEKQINSLKKLKEEGLYKGNIV